LALIRTVSAVISRSCEPTGKFEGEPSFTATDAGGKLLDVRFEVSDLLWPWSGYLALYLRVTADGAKYEGIASGEVCVHGQ
jgi:membrane-bound transcription factor site-1 protease